MPKSIGAGYNYGVIDEPVQFGNEQPVNLNKEDSSDMDQKQDKKFSRRSFLKGVPLGIAGAFVLGTISRGLFSKSQESDQYPAFPEGSIFTPAKDKNRTDA